MGKEKRAAPITAAGSSKERKNKSQRSQYDSTAPVPEGFVAGRPIPKSKHHTYFEIVENHAKKKKLEFQNTAKREPPPGFEFVPIGNPDLTNECKEISRDKDAMIFIVSETKPGEVTPLMQHMRRVGHHFREAIVEEAKAKFPALAQHPHSPTDGQPEPIPDCQQEYHAQVDAAIRDLFPRIPNTDRQDIIDNSFTQGRSLIKDDTTPVGLSDNISLARRVQLAVLAHIRHSHTRYDALLKETSWQNARKVVESLCLDTLVKWRGDDENGRDELDEILREVVVISDSEDDSEDDTSSDEISTDELHPAAPAVAVGTPTTILQQSFLPLHISDSVPVRAPLRQYKPATALNAEKKRQRGFKRYHQAWEAAVRRNRGELSFDTDMHDVQDRPAFQDAQDGADYSNRHSRDYYDSQSRLNRRDAQNRPDQDYDPAAPYLAPSRSISPPIDQFKDMLVQSIEPPSPSSAQPAFVRTVTARHMTRAGSPSRRPYRQYRSRPSSPQRTEIYQEPPPGTRPPAPSEGSSVPILVGQRPVRYIHSRAPPPTAIPVERRGHNPTYISEPVSPARRILVESTSRPGRRSTPVLMEDRGGFFERVAGPVEGNPPAMYRPPRIVSAQEGQRILREEPGVEVIQLSHHGQPLTYREPVRHFSDQSRMVDPNHRYGPPIHAAQRYDPPGENRISWDERNFPPQDPRNPLPRQGRPAEHDDTVYID